jgi:hypothetical protein
MVPGACKQENRILFRNGVRYRCRYHDEHGKGIARITVASTPCKWHVGLAMV